MSIVLSWFDPARRAAPVRLARSLLALIGLRAPGMHVSASASASAYAHARALTTVAATGPDSVVVERIAEFRSRALSGKRTVDVFLPPGYAGNPTRRYAVIYANDGQDMAGAELRGTLERLIQSHEIEPVIVVAAHATERRLEEYGTAGIPNAQGLGADAGRYEQFLLGELMPFIERRYRVLGGPAHTAVMGWSLGGLSAFDAAWRHPERFGAVGVFSGSFWWRTDDSSVAAKQSSRIMHRLVREGAVPDGARLRCWFESGRIDETDDRDGNGVIDSIQDTEELMDELSARGWRRDVDMIHVQMDGGHDIATWGSALPAWLVWAFPIR